MKIPIYQVDAFTSDVFKGNPAAVCPLKEWIPDQIMQSIAMENNLSETAFYIENNDEHHIRWFTPKAEMDLAGHPTLASAHIILKEFNTDKKNLIFKTNLGDNLNVTFKDNLYLMDFPSRPPKLLEDFELSQLEEALGKKPIKVLAYRDLIAIYDNEDEIKFKISPNSDRMGLRLIDYKIKLNDYSEIESTVVTKGSIQIPKDGNPIILMNDHPTIGGYPKIGIVILADLSKVAQLPVGELIKFKKISLKEAELLFKKKISNINCLIKSIKKENI